MYQEEFEVSGFTCIGKYYNDKILYTEEKTVSIKLDNLIVRIPEYNDSLVYIKEFDDGYFRLNNDNRFWNVEFKIHPKEPEIVCNQIEVGEVKYDLQIYNPKSNEDYFNYEYVCQEVWGDEPLNINYTGDGVGYAGCISKIKKLDLTTEWLDENAECIVCDCSYLTNRDVRNTCLTNQDECPEDNTCSKYKVGDYTIEVVR